MATGVMSWSKTAASNASADSNVNWAEGQAPSSVNDSARAEMASVAKWRDDISGTITTTGSSTAYAITSNQGFATAAAMSGAMMCIIPHTTSGASPTLAVDGLTARAINKATGAAVATGALIAGTPYVVSYIHATTEFVLQGYTEVLGSPTITGNLTVNGTATLTGAVTFSAATNQTRATVASATTTNIGAAAANYILISGTTTITAFDTVQAGTERTLEFQGALILTHNATSLILPGAANITTVAGDTAILRSEGSGNWRCISFTRATGMVSTVTTQVFTASGTYTPRTGLIYAVIDCVGGGGSGAGGTSASGRIDAGAGGHGGNYSRAIATAAAIGASQTVTIGAGGTAPSAGNTNGGAGGQTSFGAICVANGGGGGNYGAVGQIPTPGAPGAAGTGSVFAHVNGNSGGGGVNQSIITVINANSNPGGASGMGMGGARPAVAASTATATGTAAIANTGGGGGGGMGNNTATTFAGGNGGSGIVIVTEFSTQ